MNVGAFREVEPTCFVANEDNQPEAGFQRGALSFFESGPLLHTAACFDAPPIPPVSLTRN